MKKVIYIIGLALSLSSCNFLDTDVYGYISDDSKLYRDESSCMAGLTGVYDKLGALGIYGQNLWCDLDTGTDILVQSATYNKDKVLLCNNNYNNTDGTIKSTWQDLYEGINRANDYISLIEQRTSDECGGTIKKNMFLAEAKVLRALYYMNLVANWGDVPLRLEPTRDLSNQLLKSSPQKDIYEKVIIKDLLEAEAYCIPADKLNTPGRISQTTVWALLARAYMWEAGYPVMADTWNESLKWARKVKDSGLHQLYKDENGVNGYRALFINMCSNKYDLTYRESMFEVEFYGNGLDKTNESGRVGLYLGIQQTANLNDPDVPYAYGLYDGTKILFRLYDDNDERKWWNFGDYKYITVGTKSIKEYYSETTNPKKSALEDGKVGKWRAEYDPIRPWAKNCSSINYPVMRYSDVLLMIAESAAEVAGSPTQEAIDAVNLVRERVKATKVELTDFADMTDFRKFIRDERTRELCFEVSRRMELRRHGKQYYLDCISALKDMTVLENGKTVGYASTGNTAVKATPAINLAEKHLYFPIPQTELNTNPICGQNPGW